MRSSSFSSAGQNRSSVDGRVIPPLSTDQVQFHSGPLTSLEGGSLLHSHCLEDNFLSLPHPFASPRWIFDEENSLLNFFVVQETSFGEERLAMPVSRPFSPPDDHLKIVPIRPSWTVLSPPRIFNQWGRQWTGGRDEEGRS